MSIVLTSFQVCERCIALLALSNRGFPNFCLQSKTLFYFLKMTTVISLLAHSSPSNINYILFS